MRWCGTGCPPTGRGAGDRCHRRCRHRRDRVAAREPGSTWSPRPASRRRSHLSGARRQTVIDRAEFTTRKAAAEGALGGRRRLRRQPHARQRLRADPLRRPRRGLRPGAGIDFPASVAPFILRGVSLLGIDSVMAPSAARGGLETSRARPRRRRARIDRPGDWSGRGHREGARTHGRQGARPRRRRRQPLTGALMTKKTEPKTSSSTCSDVDHRVGKPVGGGRLSDPVLHPTSGAG